MQELINKQAMPSRVRYGSVLLIHSFCIDIKIVIYIPSFYIHLSDYMLKCHYMGLYTRITTLNEYYKRVFGAKVYKLALSLSGTCPNRDGSKGVGGCIFCSESGSGDFAAPVTQLEDAIKRLGDKATGRYVAYLQSFTNTYRPIKQLREHIEPLLRRSDVVGIAIATRGDCISEDTLEYLIDLNSRTHLTLELGLQSVNDDTAKDINRCCSYIEFKRGYDLLKVHNIRVCIHIMNGLPNENREDMIRTAQEVRRLQPHSVKIHCTHVIEGTVLADRYLKGEYTPMSFEDYIDVTLAQLEIIGEDIVIERLTGDGKRSSLLAPLWTLDKKRVLNALNSRLIRIEPNNSEG